MSFVLDTNIISELKKGERCSRPVWNWYDATPVEEIFMSVLVLGEMRQGIEMKRSKDPASARIFEKWLHEVEIVYEDRILPITAEICDVWGRLSIHGRLPAVDGLLAATAIHHRLTLVTRNTRDFQRCGVDYLNPFGD